MLVNCTIPTILMILTASNMAIVLRHLRTLFELLCALCIAASVESSLRRMRAVYIIICVYENTVFAFQWFGYSIYVLF